MKQKEALKGLDGFPKQTPRSVRGFEIVPSHIANDLRGNERACGALTGLGCELTMNSQGVALGRFVTARSGR